MARLSSSFSPVSIHISKYIRKHIKSKPVSSCDSTVTGNGPNSVLQGNIPEENSATSIRFLDISGMTFMYDDIKSPENQFCVSLVHIGTGYFIIYHKIFMASM